MSGLSSALLAGALSVAAIVTPSVISDTADNSGEESSYESVELNEQAKAALDEMRERVESGELTMEQAKEELEKQGITLPERGGHGGPGEHRGHGGHGPFGEFDEETREALHAIKEQVESGELTAEEGIAAAAEAGVELPDDFFTGERRDGPFGEMDEETHEAFHALRDQFMSGEISAEEAEEQAAALEIELPEGFFTSGPFGDLDQETRQQVHLLMEQLKAGEITKAEASEALEELGVELPERPGGKDRGVSDDQSESEVDAENTSTSSL